LPQAIRFDQKLGAQVPLDAEFRDEEGRVVRLGELWKDGPVVLNLVYYECPMLCNMVLDGLVRSLRAVNLKPGEDYTVVTISFDPRETAALAKSSRRTALARIGRDTPEHSWRFLTGEKPSIDRVCEAVGFTYQFDPDTGQYAHAAGIVVLTPKGVVSRYLLGIEFPPRDVQLSLVEASGNRVGSLTDQVLLMCYQYDPSQGKYGLMVFRSLRIAGLLTVSGLGIGIAVMLRQQRRKQQADAGDSRAGKTDAAQGRT
jgi:protein SCO1/2